MDLLNSTRSMLIRRNIVLDNLHQSSNREEIRGIMSCVYDLNDSDIVYILSLMNQIWVTHDGNTCVLFIVSSLQPYIEPPETTETNFVTSAISSMSFQRPTSQLIRSKSIFQHYQHVRNSKELKIKSSISNQLLSLFSKWRESEKRMPERIIFITEIPFSKNALYEISEILRSYNIQNDFFTRETIITMQMKHHSQPFNCSILNPNESITPYKLQKNKLKKISYYDPMMRYMGAEVGNVIVITDYHKQQGFIEDYRIVSETDLFQTKKIYK